MGRKTSAKRQRRRRPAGIYVSERYLEGKKTFASGSPFDAGSVKRILTAPRCPAFLPLQKEYRALTPARRIWKPAEEPLPDNPTDPDRDET